MAKKLTEKQQNKLNKNTEQLRKVKEFIDSTGFNFFNAKEMEEAFRTKAIKKSGVVNQFNKVNRSPIKDLLADQNVFDTKRGNAQVLEYINDLDKRCATYAESAVVRQSDILTSPTGDSDSQASFVTSKSHRELLSKVSKLENELVKLRAEKAKLQTFYDQYHDSTDFLDQIQIDPNTLF
ncbi:hypothetical protein BIZ37_03990 [Photobacterium sp. BZF1]|uniref:hypothetical protein n=1 Tax=Photobacterium sp. BZF1 TaxID=1904457 RepID=UPI001653653B|nr:hypothetical protein [Photobacterium sp. BZF1]MBC7001710.1 hypothetical protein [Photobacterium sp. BZF1]